MQSRIAGLQIATISFVFSFTGPKQKDIDDKKTILAGIEGLSSKNDLNVKKSIQISLSLRRVVMD